VVGVGPLLALGRRGWAAGLGAGVVVGYGLVVALPSAGLPRQFDVDTPPAFMRWLRAAAGDDYRSFGIQPDFSAVARVQDIDVVGPLAPREFDAFVRLISPRATANFFESSSTFWLDGGNTPSEAFGLASYARVKPILDWAGVRYLVLAAGRSEAQALLGADGGLERAYQDSTVQILESSAARPKVEFWSGARVYPDQAAVLAALQQEPSLILGPPLLEAGAAPRLGEGGQRVDGAVVVGSYRANEVRLAVQAPSAGLVVLKDSAYPGWQAWVDGQPTEVVRVDGLVRGAVVPSAGAHEVVFGYRPVGFVQGVVLAGLIALLLAATLLTARLRPGSGVPGWAILVGSGLLLGLLGLFARAYFVSPA
jgi:hypothetical protein